jgi:hypothetical protein
VQGCVVHVRRNSQRDGMGLPKTATSERSLRVPCSLTEDITGYVSKHEPLADGTILYTSQRNPMTDQPLTKMVVEACERAGLRWVTFPRSAAHLREPANRFEARAEGHPDLPRPLHDRHDIRRIRRVVPERRRAAGRRHAGAPVGRGAPGAPRHHRVGVPPRAGVGDPDAPRCRLPITSGRIRRPSFQEVGPLWGPTG